MCAPKKKIPSFVEIMSESVEKVIPGQLEKYRTFSTFNMSDEEIMKMIRNASLNQNAPTFHIARESMTLLLDLVLELAAERSVPKVEYVKDGDVVTEMLYVDKQSILEIRKLFIP